MVLGFEKIPDFWSCDPWRTLSVQYRKDRRGREATNCVEEILATKRGYFGNDGKEGLSYFWTRQDIIHQLHGFSVLYLQVIPACGLCQDFTCTPPEAAPLFV